MATATPNIMLKAISGRIGNVVFYTNRGRQCVRTYVVPRNPDTAAQRAVRRSFGDAVRSWQAMSQDEQYAYTRKARSLNISGYNLYISNYLKRAMQAVNYTPIYKQKSKVPSLKKLPSKPSHSFPTPGTWNLQPGTIFRSLSASTPFHLRNCSHIAMGGPCPG
jgi:hypothetical protein